MSNVKLLSNVCIKFKIKTFKLSCTQVLLDFITKLMFTNFEIIFLMNFSILNIIKWYVCFKHGSLFHHHIILEKNKHF